jgi:hypothetical protein
MDYYEIKDLRELYKNDLTQLRKMKFWIKWNGNRHNR